MGRINWRKYGLLIFSLPVVVILFCASAFSSLLAPYDPYYLDVMYMLEGPSSGHLFGTDELGWVWDHIVGETVAEYCSFSDPM